MLQNDFKWHAKGKRTPVLPPGSGGKQTPLPLTNPWSLVWFWFWFIVFSFSLFLLLIFFSYPWLFPLVLPCVSPIYSFPCFFFPSPFLPLCSRSIIFPLIPSPHSSSMCLYTYHSFYIHPLSDRASSLVSPVTRLVWSWHVISALHFLWTAHTPVQFSPVYWAWSTCWLCSKTHYSVSRQLLVPFL